MTGVCSYPNYTCLKFEPGTWFILGNNLDGQGSFDSNGSGKTTIFEAIVWAIFGKTSKGRRSSKIVSRGYNEAWVRLTLGEWSEDPDLVIKRVFNTKESLEYTLKGGEKVTGDLKATQQQLLELLDITFGTFCSSVFLGGGSHSVQFLEAEPSERAKILSHLIDDRQFLFASQLIESDCNLLNDKFQEVKTQAKLNDQNILHQEEVILEITDQLRSRADLEKTRTQGIEAEMDQRRRLLDTINDKISAIQGDAIDVKQINAERAELYTQLSAQREESDKFASLAGPDPSFQTAGEVCHSCSQVISSQHLEKRKSKYAHNMELRRVSRAKEREISDRITVLDAKIARHANRQTELRSLDLRRNEIRSDLLHLSDELTQKISVSDLQEKLAHAKQFLQSYQAKSSELEKLLDQIPLQQKRLRELYSAFSKDIKNMMFDILRDSLEANTAKFVNALAGESYQVRYPVTNRENFEITVSHNGYEQDLKGFSEGESWRVSFAILLALREILTDRCRTKWDFIMIDDPVGKIDETGTSELMDILRGLSEGECTTVLCTLPLDRYITGGDLVLRVTKQFGQSRVQVESN